MFITDVHSSKYLQKRFVDIAHDYSWFKIKSSSNRKGFYYLAKPNTYIHSIVGEIVEDIFPTYTYREIKFYPVNWIRFINTKDIDNPEI